MKAIDYINSNDYRVLSDGTVYARGTHNKVRKFAKKTMNALFESGQAVDVLSAKEVKAMAALETLTADNIAYGILVIDYRHPQWGTKPIQQDRNGWTIGVGANGRMLCDSEMHVYKIVA